MLLTTLRPNRTLLWKEWKGIAILAAVFFALFTYLSSYTFSNDIMFYKEQLENGVVYGMYQTAALLHYQSGGWLLWVFFAAGLAARMVGAERDQSTYDMLLATPYTRGQILHHKFMVGLGVVLAVVAVNGLVMTLLMAVNTEVVFPFSAAAIWAWAGRHMVVLGFIFAFTLLVSTVSGTTMGNGILGLIFLFFPGGFAALVTINLDYWGLSYTHSLMAGLEKWGVLLTVPGYIAPFPLIDMNDYNVALIYGCMIAAALGAYVLAQYLFARNQMEYNGEILMFKRLEGVFKLGVAVCFALLGGPMLVYGWDLSPWGGIISYVTVGVVFWFITTGIINWRRRDTGETAPGAGSGGGSAVIWVGLALLVAVVLFGVRVM